VLTLGSKLRLYFRPPYAPERKPDALVWKHRKAAGRMAVIATDDFAKKVRRAIPAFLCLLGRNSLSVFCALSLLSLSEQIFRSIYGGHVASDAFVVILGVLLMGFIAWTAEWRERLRAALPNRPLSP
jgi:OpgC protein